MLIQYLVYLSEENDRTDARPSAVAELPMEGGKDQFRSKEVDVGLPLWEEPSYLNLKV